MNFEKDTYRRLAQVCGFVTASTERTCEVKGTSFSILFRSPGKDSKELKEDARISFDGKKFEVWALHTRPKTKDKVFIVRPNRKLESNLVYPSQVKQVLDILDESGIDTSEVRSFLEKHGHLPKGTLSV